MREIKFRAYHELYGMMQVTDMSVCVDGTIHYFTDNLRGGYYDLDNPKNALMQYTGLKDKNGKEIYEGDILRWTPPHNNPIVLKPITYDEHYLCYFTGDKCSHKPWLTSEVEVIGNIYENPELLEESK